MCGLPSRASHPACPGTLLYLVFRLAKRTLSGDGFSGLGLPFPPPSLPRLHETGG